MLATQGEWGHVDQRPCMGQTGGEAVQEGTAHLGQASPPSARLEILALAWSEANCPSRSQQLRRVLSGTGLPSLVHGKFPEWNRCERLVFHHPSPTQMCWTATAPQGRATGHLAAAPKAPLSPGR